MEIKQNCYTCKHSRPLPGDAHLQCSNLAADIKLDPRGYQWCFPPFNIDPCWLKSCTGYESKEKE